MRSMNHIITTVTLAAGLLGVSMPCGAQEVQYVFQPEAGISTWNDQDNWLGNDAFVFVPDADEAAGEVAFLDTNATAQVSLVNTPRVGEVLLESGTILIDSAGRLETFRSSTGSGLTTGAVILARSETLMEIRDSGSLEVGTILSSSGGIHLYGPNASVDVGSDALLSGSVLGAHITGATHGLVTVGGAADLSGTLEVEVSGVVPSFGTSWDLVTAAGGITQMFQQINVVDAPALARGLQYQAVSDGNTAALEVGNTLLLTVDRQTGAMSMENAIGAGLTIDSYAVRSAAGSLSVAGAQSLNGSGVAGTGWSTSPVTNQLIAEVKPDSTFTLGVGQSVSLGTGYSLGVSADNEDLAFDFTTTDGRVYQGAVEYVGAPNDFVLYVDPSDGSVSMGNLSSFITAPELTSYAIQSPSGQLLTGTWDSLQASGEAGSGWLVSTASSSSLLVESNLEESFLFDNGTLVSLGQAFTSAGGQDLEFLYTVAGEEIQRTGTVVYGSIPVPPEGLDGDYNDDGVVDAVDYAVWRESLGQSITLPNESATPGVVTSEDYSVWRSNYGLTSNAPTASGLQGVPEPGIVSLLMVAVTGVLIVRRDRASSLVHVV